MKNVGTKSINMSDIMDQQKRELREKREAWLKGKTDSPLGREEIKIWGENRDQINLEEEAIDSETWELEAKRLVKGKKRDFVENTREEKPQRKKRRETV